MKHLVVGSEAQEKSLTLFKGGHIRRILVVLWETRPSTIARKRGTSYLNVISCRIRIRELLNKKGSN